MPRTRAREKGREIYLDILEKYPKTKSAKEAKRLLDELNASRRKLKLAEFLAGDALKLGNEDLKEKAKVRCQEIIKMYPETEAAGGARELLDKLSK
jgi:TolA-binding protein